MLFVMLCNRCMAWLFENKGKQEESDCSYKICATQLVVFCQKKMNFEGENMPSSPLEKQGLDWVPACISDLAFRTHNPIRTVVEGCNLQPSQEKPMIALSLGDPTVFGNLNPHEEVICNVIESIKSSRFNGYGPSTGIEEARIAVAEYSSTKNVRYHCKDIILTNGCSAAIDYCITCLANPGQNILIPFPGFPLYKTLAESLGIRTKPYNLMPTKSWEIDLNHLRSQIDENTVAILINNPSNPCGSVFSYQLLMDILQIARIYHLPIIADEIYENMVFKDQEFFPIADLSEDVPILTCSGLSKRFLVPGWRVGWIKIHDPIQVFPAIRKGLVSISQKTLGCSTVIQGALPKILTGVPQTYFDEVMNTIEKTAKLAYSLIDEVKGLYPIMPQGAMYMMVEVDIERFPAFKTTLELIERMVQEESLFCLPGACFDYPNYMRLVLTLPEELMMEACQRLSEFCGRYYKDGKDIQQTEASIELIE